MCLAVPGKIISIDDSTPDLVMARVDFGGVTKNICVQWVDVLVGDYILAHAGMAISVLNEAEAKQTLDDLNAISQANETRSDS